MLSFHVQICILRRLFNSYNSYWYWACIQWPSVFKYITHLNYPDKVNVNAMTYEEMIDIQRLQRHCNNGKNVNTMITWVSQGETVENSNISIFHSKLCVLYLPSGNLGILHQILLHDTLCTCLEIMFYFRSAYCFSILYFCDYMFHGSNRHIWIVSVTFPFLFTWPTIALSICLPETLHVGQDTQYHTILPPVQPNYGHCSFRLCPNRI